MNGDRDEALARIRRARAIAGTDEARQLYADWAEHYDSDVFGTLQVTGSAHIAGLLATHLAPQDNPSILDAGCGTGAVGVLLHDRGFRHIDGLDISPQMLAVAARKQVYRAMAEADLNLPFEAPLRRYDAVVSAGTFVHGHMGGEGFCSLVRLLAPGGIIACAVADNVWTLGSFDRLIAGAGLTVLHHAQEAVLPDGPADVHMLVAKRVESNSRSDDSI
ncbi:MAG: class I SAM-dependent methyltransferase [Anderseniella sp.]|jgi:predicted TPR repeat methyltransferase|nr:class I SAM-dependent methyltransferase [Anderseniella sp.]